MRPCDCENDSKEIKLDIVWLQKEYSKVRKSLDVALSELNRLKKESLQSEMKMNQIQRDIMIKINKLKDQS